jgi:hypothetical protein
MHSLCDIGGNNTTYFNYKEFTGNIIPNSWYKKITNNSGKPDLNSIAILAEIVYWYRPSKDGTSKFKGDAWQSSYEYFEKKFGFNREAIRRIFVKLERLKLLNREFRTIEYRGHRYNNVLFLHLNKEILFESRPEKDIGQGKKISMDHQEFATPSPQNCGDHIEGKNKLEKNRSAHEYALSDFYDLMNEKLDNSLVISTEDIDFLNKQSGREFSQNFIKQLVLKLSIKYPEHKFSKKDTFLNYMIKALANEKHQAAAANNKDFKFSILPITLDQEYNQNVNRFLDEIESSTNTAPDFILKKKIAGRLAPNIAYELLTKASINMDDDRLKVEIHRPLKIDNSPDTIPEWIEKIIFEEAKLLWGENLIYIHKISAPPKNLVIPKIVTPLSQNNIWGKIMDKLRDYYGEETSNVWFSKLSFMDNIENFITIKSPTGFIRDWVKTNYGLIIEKELCAYYTQGFTLEFT